MARWKNLLTLPRDYLLLRRSGLFDRLYYYSKNSDVETGGDDPILHFLLHGAREGRDPSPLFDVGFYLLADDVRHSGVNPLVHYIRRGAEEGRDPHPLFSTVFYREQAGVRLLPGMNPLRHFLESGWKEGLAPHPLFDTAFYLEKQADVAAQGVNPIIHFLLLGGAEARAPHYDFDVAYYLWQVPSLVQTRQNPLVHYLKAGAKEGINPSVRFDTAYYRETNPDVAAGGMNPLVHYVLYGRAEGRAALPRGGYQGLRLLKDRRPVNPYDAWLAVNAWTPERKASLEERLRGESGLPCISVVMPVFNPPKDVLEEAVASVLAQVYVSWELCIADDASTDPSLRGRLERIKAVDSRIKVTFRPENGHISEASNSAAALATGDFLLMLDQDDTLEPDAVAEIALHVAGQPDTDLVYSDTDKIDAGGRRFDPQFKPDWSPELLLCYMYAGQVLAIRRTLFESLGGMRKGLESVQDHDLVLRAAERARRVGHIPRVLYHWRAISGSGALDGKAKDYGFERAERAINEALQRRGCVGRAVQPDWARRNGNCLFHLEFPHEGPDVTIIVPTRNNAACLERCLTSLRKTLYRTWTVLIVDNGSKDTAALEVMNRSGFPVLRLERPGGSFNFAWLINRAMENTVAEFVLLLNDDTEVMDPRWLSQMMGYARMEGVGAVGARLVYPDGRIQHAGIVLGMDGGLAGHAFRHQRQDDPGYLGYALLPRNCAAVTAACLLTRRSFFDAVGGFDEKNLGVAYNDVDYGMRLREKGWRVVYAPDACLLHHEGSSRGKVDDPREVAFFRERVRQRRDPFFNPSLDPGKESFSILPRALPGAEEEGPVRVLAFSHNLNREGATGWLFDLLATLQSRGVAKVTVAAGTEGPMRRFFEEAGIKIKIFPTPDAGVDEAGIEAWGKKAALLVEETRAGLAMVNTFPSWPAVRAMAVAGVPCVWIIHESFNWATWFHSVHRDHARLAAESFKVPYRCVFVSKAAREAYESLNLYHNFEVVCNGLKPGAGNLPEGVRAGLRSELGIDDRHVLFLTVGTVCEHKGQEDIVEAATRLSASASSLTRFVIVGDTGKKPAYAGRLRARLRTLGMTDDCVRFCPETDEIGRYYAAADVYLAPSRVDSYPTVILEAMAHGLPILTTGAGGIREQVRPGFNAELYEAGDAERLARLVELWTLDPAERRRHAEFSSASLAALTSFDDMVSAYTGLIREAAGMGRMRTEENGKF